MLTCQQQLANCSLSNSKTVNNAMQTGSRDHFVVPFEIFWFNCKIKFFTFNILCFWSDFFNRVESKWQVFADLSVSAMQAPGDHGNLLTTNAVALVPLFLQICLTISQLKELN